MRDRAPARRPRGRPEPAIKRGAVVAVLGVLASLGFGWAADLDRDTVGIITVALNLALPLLQAAWTRYAVTPNAATLAYLDDHGTPVAGEAAATVTAEPLPSLPTPDGDAYLITRAQPSAGRP